MDAAATQLPDEPAIHCAESELPSIGKAAHARHLIKDPSNLACRKIRIDHQPRPLLYRRFVAFSFEPIAKSGGATVLPNNRVVNRFPSLAVPYNGCFALVGNPD